MTDDLEQRLRALRPVPMPATTRVRIVAAIHASRRQPLSRLGWVPSLAAAALAIAVLSVVQATASRPAGAGLDDESLSYGLLMRHGNAPLDLLEAIDRGRRPIPRFATFDSVPAERNRR